MVRPLRATFAIAINAYREAVRDRVLIGVLGVGAASLLFGLSLAWLSLTEQVRILVDHGVVTLSWLANVVAIFLGASFLYKEIELRTLYVILSKPLPRWQFVLGKYLGIVCTVVMFELITASLLLLLLDLQTAEATGVAGSGLAALSRQLSQSRAARGLVIAVLAIVALSILRIFVRSERLRVVREVAGGAGSLLAASVVFALCVVVARQVAPVETRYVLYATVLVAAEVLITAAIAMVFSSFSTPFVTGLLTFGAFLVGRSAGAMLELRGRQLPAALRDALHGIASVVPNLHVFVPSRSGLLPADTGVGAGWFLLQSIAYAGLYAAILMAAAMWLFRKRDLT